MATIDRWAEYSAGTIEYPAVVRLDEPYSGVHYAWIAVEVGVAPDVVVRIIGPLSCGAWDAAVEARLLSAADALADALEDTYEFVVGDGGIV